MTNQYENLSVEYDEMVEKNRVIVAHAQRIEEEYNALKNSLQQIDQFIHEFKIIQKEYPDFNSEKILFTLQKFSDEIMDKNKTNLQLEQDNQELRNMKKVYEKKFLDKQADIMNDYNLRERQLQQTMDSLKEKESEFVHQSEYKNKYMEMFNKIVSIYSDWNTKFHKVFAVQPVKDGGPVIDLSDPLKMLNVMQEQIQITTNSNMMDYLRKIIVSANILQRKYLPEYVNDKFDVSKIYERLLKKMDFLEAQNKKYMDLTGKKQKNSGERVNTNVQSDAEQTEENK